MILSCHHISKAFGEESILKDASFGVEEHEKTAIVGINGAGKTTLLKIIVGELPPDEGEVILAKGKTFGYLAQQKMLSGHQSIYDELMEAKKDIRELEERIRELELTMKSLSGARLEEAMEQYHRMQTRFEQENGYALESEVAGILKGLGFSEEEFDRGSDTLSGGQKTRVALGKLLLSSPDIILLDEPTNHLDMNSIAWLENYLKNYRGAVIIVSHDRYFLNRVVTKVVEIDQGQVTSFDGNYSAYAEKKQQLREAALKAWMNQQAQIRHQEEVIARLRSFNREKSIRRAESREKMLDKIQVLDKPREEKAQIHLTLEPGILSGNDVLMVEGLSKSFGPLRLFSNLSFTLRRGERAAVIGDNGTGKTTLLKIINGLLEPDQGSVRLGSRVVIGYYDQEHQVLHPEKTLFEEISDAYPDLDNTRIRSVLAAFLFTGDEVFKRIQDLSGGERGRVSLAKLMLSQANLLILDEPTNHLDIFSKEILEQALNRYTGTVLYVSHDRYFINQTATRILELTDQSLVGYVGNYDYYREKKEELAQTKAPAADRPGEMCVPKEMREETASSREDWKRKKEEQARERKRASDLKRTEEEIASLEERDRQIDELLNREEVFTDMERCTALTTEKADIGGRLARLYDRWENLAQ